MPTQRQCPHCDRQFSRTEHLSRHVRSHTKEKPFQCGECGKAYIREDTLHRHTKTHRSTSVRKEPRAVTDGRDNGIISGRRRLSVTTPLGVHVRDPDAGQDGASQFCPDPNMYMPAADDMTAIGMPETHQMQMPTPIPTGAWDFWSTSFSDDLSMFAMDAAVNIAPVNTLVQDMRMLDQGLLSNVQHLDEPSPLEFTMPHPVVNVGQVWFTKLPNNDDNTRHSSPPSHATTPMPQTSDPTGVDDEYRLRLSRSFLTPPPQNDPLPSSDFMNLCVRMYFTHFSPLFPVLHGATFRPTAENGLLLLSITSVGCLFLGSAAAVRRGRQIFEKLNKAILASWERVLARKTTEGRAMVQASIIGQTFGLLSGDPRHIATCETFHGAVIALARRENMFDAQAATPEIGNLNGAELEAAWRLWAQKEEMNRACASLRIHDAEISALLHCEPLLRRRTSEPSPLSTSKLFSAATASEWASIVNHEATTRGTGFRSNPDIELRDSFSAYVLLEGFGTSIAEDRRQGCLGSSDDAPFSSYNEALMNWYITCSGSATEQQPGKFDFDQLERAISRDGPEAASAAVDYVSDWISSPNSTRCVLHAFLLQKQLQSLRFDTVPAIHVPRILFSAAIAWYCYLQYGPADSVAPPLFHNLNAQLPEFGILVPAAQKHLFDITRLSWKHGEMSDVKAATLCELGDSLQRIGRWGIAGEFAKIVACLIYGGIEGATNE